MGNDAGLVYRRCAPSPTLAPYVEHYWLVSAPAKQQPQSEILIPNGRPMLLFSFGESSLRIDPLSGERVPNGNTISEITSQPFVIEQLGESSYIGVQIQPYGLSALMPGKRIVNHLTPLDQWLGEAQAAALMSALTAHEFGLARIEIIDTYLQSKLMPLEPELLETLKAAVEAIEKASGELNIEALAQQHHMHYTTFYRLFKKHLGISPKQFLEIVRYYKFVGELLHSVHRDPIAQIAALQGYFDQAHAAKEFRQFTGVTPNTFRTTLNGIATLMHQD